MAKNKIRFSDAYAVFARTIAAYAKDRKPHRMECIRWHRLGEEMTEAYRGKRLSDAEYDSLRSLLNNRGGI